jgi:4-hydroxy-3-polyprenylbenzoate decarboxylase
MWAVATRCEPSDSIHVIPETLANYLDPIIPPDKRAADDMTKSRAIIIACRPYIWRNQFAPVVRASDPLRKEVQTKWAELLGPFPAEPRSASPSVLSRRHG